MPRINRKDMDLIAKIFWIVIGLTVIARVLTEIFKLIRNSGEDLMCSNILSTLSVLMNASGIIILYFYARPQPNFDEGIGLGLENGTELRKGFTVSDSNKKQREMKRLYKRMSILGLTLIILGVILQLVTVWI